MTEKQKQAINILNNLRLSHGGTLISAEEYFILLDFVVGNDVPSYLFPRWDDHDKELKDIPISVAYGCGVPNTMTTYTSAETDNSNKVE